MGRMKDWPEFKMKTESGEGLMWTRHAKEADTDRAFREGARVEVDYVMQKHKLGSFTIDRTRLTKCVTEIRIESEPND